MKNNEFSKKITSLLVTGTVVISTALTLTSFKLIDRVKDQKPYEYVLRDLYIY